MAHPQWSVRGIRNLDYPDRVNMVLVHGHLTLGNLRPRDRNDPRYSPFIRTLMAIMSLEGEYQRQLERLNLSVLPTRLTATYDQGGPVTVASVVTYLAGIGFSTVEARDVLPFAQNWAHGYHSSDDANPDEFTLTRSMIASGQYGDNNEATQAELDHALAGEWQPSDDDSGSDGMEDERGM
jgi:hypothetical protein